MNARRSALHAATPLGAAFLAVALCGCVQQPAASADTAPLQASSSASGFRASEPRASSRVTVPQGTEVHMTLASSIGSATSSVGDSVTGTTTSAIVIGDQVAIPVGSTVHGRITGVDPATKGLDVSEKGGAIALSFTKLTTPAGDSSSMSGSLTSIAKSGGKTGGIIGGSAAGGALLGKILGGSTKDAAIGAVIGTGIGTGIAAGTKGKEVVIPAGTDLALTLDQPLILARR